MADGTELRAWQAALAALLAGDRLAQPDELPAVVNAAVASLGLDITLYVVDQEQRTLRPVPRPGRPTPEAVDVDATIAGRAFTTAHPVASPAGHGHPGRLWMPLLHGGDRLGVLDVVNLNAETDIHGEEFRAGCDLLSQMIGHLFSGKLPCGDTLLRAKRTRRMSEASELVWRLLPPLTFASHRVVIAAVLEPSYDVGGDGFDYAVDGSTAFFAVFDTVGHDLRSGLGTSTVLAAVRAARADGAGLHAMARAADAALAKFMPEQRFTTAVMGTLDLETGQLRYINAGHPAPMLLRNGNLIARLDRGRRLPLGLDDARTEIAEETLEPGDRILLFTDGVTEARKPGPEPFGEGRLLDLVRQTTAAGLPAPETLRRLCRAVLDHYGGPPADDATLLFVEWASS